MGMGMFSVAVTAHLHLVIFTSAALTKYGSVLLCVQKLRKTVNTDHEIPKCRRCIVRKNTKNI